VYLPFVWASKDPCLFDEEIHSYFFLIIVTYFAVIDRSSDTSIQSIHFHFPSRQAGIIHQLSI